LVRNKGATLNELYHPVPTRQRVHKIVIHPPTPEGGPPGSKLMALLKAAGVTGAVTMTSDPGVTAPKAKLPAFDLERFHPDWTQHRGCETALAFVLASNFLGGLSPVWPRLL
jgi:hypothetical protein